MMDFVFSIFIGWVTAMMPLMFVCLVYALQGRDFAEEVFHRVDQKTKHVIVNNKTPKESSND